MLAAFSVDTAEKCRAGEMTVGDGNASTNAGSAAALGAAGWRKGSARRTAPRGGRARSERTRSAPPSGLAAPEVVRRVRDLHMGRSTGCFEAQTPVSPDR
jgi:hypothetical protein